VVFYFDLLSDLCQNQTGILAGFYSEATPRAAVAVIADVDASRALLTYSDLATMYVAGVAIIADVDAPRALLT
jgi:hypothetical protein